MNEEKKTEANLIEFSKHNVAFFHRLAEFKAVAKKMEQEEKQIKQKLMDEMDRYGITSFSNNEISISYVGASVQTSLDINAFKKQEPQLYEELMKDYGKTTERSAYLKLVVKAEL